jgi:hypothetical protein
MEGRCKSQNVSQGKQKMNKTLTMKELPFVHYRRQHFRRRVMLMWLENHKSEEEREEEALIWRTNKYHLS